MEASPETVSKLAWNIAAPFRASKPVIAANRGFCFGVGFELSLACDFRIVTDTTQYALPEQKLGQIPGSGGSARLQMMVGITRTKDIVMRSKRISAQQALDWGIATEKVADADLEKATDALVDELVAFSPMAQRTAKKLLNDTEDSPSPSPSSWKAIATAASGNPTTSRRASRPSTRSASPSSRAAEHTRHAPQGPGGNNNVRSRYTRRPCRHGGGEPPAQQRDHRIRARLVARFVRPVHPALCGAGGGAVVLPLHPSHMVAGGGLCLVRGDAADAAHRLGPVRPLCRRARPQGRHAGGHHRRRPLHRRLRPAAHHPSGGCHRSCHLPAAAPRAGRVRGRPWWPPPTPSARNRCRPTGAA